LKNTILKKMNAKGLVYFSTSSLKNATIRKDFKILIFLLIISFIKLLKLSQFLIISPQIIRQNNFYGNYNEVRELTLKNNSQKEVLKMQNN
jgi:hypothetical protein